MTSESGGVCAALSGDERARREAFVRERALRDEITEKAEAEARGEARGQVNILRRLLLAKFGELSASVDERLQTAESDQLAHWADRALFAETLEQVFSQH